MRESLIATLDHIRRFEGGFINHPSDPGGATNLGITLDTYRALINPRGTVADLKRLTWIEAARAYELAYWQKIRGDDLPVGVDLVVCDMAVNAGPVTASKLLQRAAGADQDGIIGLRTLAAVGRQKPGALARAYTAQRLAYYRSLRHWRVFGRGWKRRADAALESALSLIREHHGPG